jgi:hypothetical protein
MEVARIMDRELEDMHEAKRGVKRRVFFVSG